MLGRRRSSQPFTLEPLPDGLPKAGLFAEPVRIGRFTASHEPHGDERVRVTFLVEIRDATDRRCSDLFVEAVVSSPDRNRVVSGTTDLLGRIRFRIVGVNGVYHATITNVAANGLAWDDAHESPTVTYDTTAPLEAKDD